MPGVIDLLALRVVSWELGAFLFTTILILGPDSVGVGIFACEKSESRRDCAVRHDKCRTSSLTEGER